MGLGLAGLAWGVGRSGWPLGCGPMLGMGVVVRREWAVGAALLLVGAVAPLVSPVGVGVAEAAAVAAMPFDFDGDGYADLAVGVPGEDLRGIEDVGAVQVMYGSAAGVTTRDQLWHHVVTNQAC